MAMTLSREKILQEWTAIIEGGGGREKWVLEKTQEAIRAVNAPGVETRRETISSGKLSGVQREFLVVTHYRLKEYAMLINARSMGKHLDVAWYLTVNPGFFKRALSRKLADDPNAISKTLDVFANQDLSAYTTIANQCFQNVLRELTDNELKQDYATIPKRSKGYLSQW